MTSRQQIPFGTLCQFPQMHDTCLHLKDKNEMRFHTYLHAMGIPLFLIR